MLHFIYLFILFLFVASTDMEGCEGKRVLSVLSTTDTLPCPTIAVLTLSCVEKNQ